MKRTLISVLAAATVAVMLLSSASMAEGTPEAAETPAVQQEMTLEEAQEAYRAAKEAAGMTEFEQELAEMVANGQLTQEQADLLLKAAQDAEAMKDGTCPNCGYEFSANVGMGRGRGMNKGMMMGKGRGNKH